MADAMLEPAYPRSAAFRSRIPTLAGKIMASTPAVPVVRTWKTEGEKKAVSASGEAVEPLVPTKPAVEEAGVKQLQLALPAQDNG